MKSHFCRLLLLLLYCSSLRAQSITIYRGGIALSPSYTSIQDAVNHCVSADSLVLSDDVFYQGSIYINKSLSITGTITSKGSSTINASRNTSTAIFVNNPGYKTADISIYLKDIAITNGFADNGYTRGGGGICADSGVNLILDGYTKLYGNKTRIPGPSFARYSPFGGAIYAIKNVLLEGHTEIYSNTAYKEGGGIYTLGSVMVSEYAKCYGNYSENSGGGISASRIIVRDHGQINSNASGIGGGIYADRYLSVSDSGMIAYNNANNGGGIYANDSLIIKDNVMVRKNTAHSGAGIFAQHGFDISKSTLIDSNKASFNGGGIYLFNGQGILRDSAKVLFDTADLSGAGIYVNAGTLSMTNKTIIAGAKSRATGSGIYMNSGTLNMNDSAVIGFNLTDAAYGAGIYAHNSDIFINGGQIFSNRSAYDSVLGKGMAIYNDTAIGFAPNIKVNKTRVFNRNGNNIQQNEFYNLHPSLTMNSDSTWWGDSDTSGVFYNQPGTTFHLNSWVVADWTINKGAPLGTLASFPVDAYFHLNTGAALPAHMFWMLVGLYFSDSGSFISPIAAMSGTNIISGTYFSPWTTQTINLLSTVDADSFKRALVVKGLGFKEHIASGDVIKIYPNPSDGHFTVTSLRESTTKQSIKIYDLLGRCIHQQTITEKETQIKLNTATGIYILEFNDEEGNFYRERIAIQ